MNSTYQTPDALRHDARTLGNDAQALIAATAEIADVKVAQARQRLESSLERAKDSLHRADNVIRSHPYESLGAALVLGTFLGTFLGALVARRN